MKISVHFLSYTISSYNEKCFRHTLKYSYCYVCSVLCILSHCVFLCIVCVNVYWTNATGISGHFSTTLTEVYPCFFLSCKANVRV
jgi:hypothetical protein